MFKITVDIYEQAEYPIVRHVFIGSTKKEAEGYEKSHRTTDSFYKHAIEKKPFPWKGGFLNLRYKAYAEEF